MSPHGEGGDDGIVLRCLSGRYAANTCCFDCDDCWRPSAAPRFSFSAAMLSGEVGRRPRFDLALVFLPCSGPILVNSEVKLVEEDIADIDGSFAASLGKSYVESETLIISVGMFFLPFCSGSFLDTFGEHEIAVTECFLEFDMLERRI